MSDVSEALKRLEARFAEHNRKLEARFASVRFSEADSVKVGGIVEDLLLGDVELIRRSDGSVEILTDNGARWVSLKRGEWLALLEQLDRMHSELGGDSPVSSTGTSPG